MVWGGAGAEYVLGMLEAWVHPQHIKQWGEGAAQPGPELSSELYMSVQAHSK